MWIEDYRKQKGIELDEFARLVNIAGRRMKPPLEGVVSDTLIHTLERMRTPRTHPRIADAIATVCGATQEQRDSIVDARHKGTWEKISFVDTWHKAVKEEENGHKIGYEKPVVKVNSNGKILARYGSLTAAENNGSMSLDAIRTRCRHGIKNEFVKQDFTYRFADEWDKMTQLQRLQDLGIEVEDSLRAEMEA